MYLPRALLPDIQAHTRDFPVLLITGARQVGKSTLAMRLGIEHYLTLDDINIYEAARLDPRGFIHALPRPVVIDEIQRLPQLLLAIKECVDARRENGAFVLTGSTSLQGFQSVSDSLAGRIGIVELYPLSLKEKRGKAEENVIDLLLGDFSPYLMRRYEVDLVGELIRGGYPELLRIDSDKGRYLWFSSYIRTYIEADARELAHVRNLDKFIKMYRLAMLQSAGLFNKSAIQQAAGLDNRTFDAYFNVLEQTYQLQRLPPYFNNRLKRLVKTPKLFACDSGILCHLLQITTPEAWDAARERGAVLETWVLNELVRANTSARIKAELSYYRTSDKKEIDFILEAAGKVTAIEVKAATVVGQHDFKHVRHLQSELGPAFDKGVVLYRGERFLAMGERLYAVPLGFLA